MDPLALACLSHDLLLEVLHLFLQLEHLLLKSGHALLHALANHLCLWLWFWIWQLDDGCDVRLEGRVFGWCDESGEGSSRPGT